jgi:prepilin-type processing-associated H-X9-DG protein
MRVLSLAAALLALLPLLAPASAREQDARPKPEAVLAPFLDESTLAVGRLDATSLAPRKLAAFLTKSGFVAREIDKKDLDQLVQQSEAFVAAAKAAGVGQAYVVVRFDAAFDRLTSFFPLTDVLFLFPGATDGEALLRLLNAKSWQPGREVNPPYFSWFIKDKTLALGLGQVEARWVKRPATPRPDLLAALAEGGDAVAVLAFAPSKDQARALTETMPRLPLEIGGQQSALLLAGCTSAALALDQEKPALRLSIKSASPAAALELEKWLKERYAQVAAIPDVRKALPMLAGSEDVLLPKARGAGLALELDAAQPRLGELARSTRDAILKNRASALSGARMRGIVIALHNYHNAFGELPSDLKDKKTGKPLLSWRVALLPFLGHADLFRKFNTFEPWDSPHNKELLRNMPDIFRRPPLDASMFGYFDSRDSAADNPEAADRTPYLAPIYPGTAFAEAKPLSLGKLTQGDGTSNTIGLVEVADGFAVPWTKPQDWTITEAGGTNDLHYWPDGLTNVAFFDGSVRGARRNMPFKMLRQLIGWNDSMNDDPAPWFGR